MMIIDPVTLGDVACSRASVKYVYDRTGTLVQVPANTLAVTYDPSDLAKAPYALVEAAATNLLLRSQEFSYANVWGYGANGGLSENAVTAPDGTQTADAYTHGTSTGTFAYLSQIVSGDASQALSFSMWIKVPSGSSSVSLVVSDGTLKTLGGALQQVGTGWVRLSFSVSNGALSNTGSIGIGIIGTAGQVYHVWGAQLEVGSTASSYIPTAGAVASRAADVIAAGAGLVYSNVPITETPYSGASTYALNAVVYDPASYLTYQSLIASNTGHALTDTASWSPLLTAVNRWQMFDQYNNTQTSNAEEIIVVLTPQALAQGVYIGNADASDIRISTYDPTDGLVYQETQNLIISDSGSSFYNWCFKRIRKKSYAVSVQLPPYYAGLVTITLRKPGGTAKCGMCVLGPLVDVGLSQYGLSREIKDYSTVNFNFDGTSNVVKRNFAKIMDVDVILDNDYIDSVIESLEGYRQKPVAWIGTAAYGSACLYGTYTSFKNVIQYPTQSAMNLQIQGTV